MQKGLGITGLAPAGLLTGEAAWLPDRGDECAKGLGTSGTETHAGWEAVQIYGGHRSTDEHGVLRSGQDIRILRIGEGTDEIQRLAIARYLGC